MAVIGPDINLSPLPIRGPGTTSPTTPAAPAATANTTSPTATASSATSPTGPQPLNTSGSLGTNVNYVT